MAFTRGQRTANAFVKQVLSSTARGMNAFVKIKQISYQSVAKVAFLSAGCINTMLLTVASVSRAFKRLATPVNVKRASFPY